MKSLRHRIFGTLFVLSTVFAVSAVTTVFAAEDYPSKPVRLIVPWPPGGGVDAVGRLVAAKLTERLGKQVVVENRGGAGGIIGTEAVAKADPDGYTIVIAAPSHTLQLALMKLPYHPIKSFVPIAKLGIGAEVLAVFSGLPVNSVKDLIALAQKKPGQLIFVSPGIGGSIHLATELFKMMADIDFKIVHFRGGGPAMIDLIGGHSNACIGSLIQVLPHLKSGKLRALATTGAKRSVILPNVPTIAEAALPGFETTQWWGILAPAGTPTPIVDRLSNELKAILTMDEVKKRFLNDGAEVDYLGPAEFGTFLEREISDWERVVKKANIKLEEQK